MNQHKLADYLRQVGLTADAASVYLTLLNRLPGPMHELRTEPELSGVDVAAGYAELVHAGLASAVPDNADLRLLPPGTGLEVLGKRRSAQLAEAEMGISNAFTTSRPPHPVSCYSDLIEVVTGDERESRITQIIGAAREQVRTFDSPPYFLDRETNSELALSLIARGVTHRTVYGRTAWEHEPEFDHWVQKLIRAGESARVLPSLPVKITIVDDKLALLSRVTADTGAGFAVIRPCGLLSALDALFEASWQTALPLYGATSTGTRVAPADRRLLSMMCAGLGDDQIARRLGVSRRTFFRRLESLMIRCGAHSRFQLAMHAQQRGWL